MKYNNQKSPSIKKIHYSVREMIEEARQITRPQSIFRSTIKQNKQIEQNKSPPSKFAKSLQEILYSYSQNYKRIKRNKKQLNDKINKTIEIVKDRYLQKDICKSKDLDNSRQLIHSRKKISKLQHSIKKCEIQLIQNDYKDLKEKYNYRYILKTNTLHFLPLITTKQQNKNQQNTNTYQVAKQNININYEDLNQQLLKQKQLRQSKQNKYRLKCQKIRMRNKKIKLKRSKVYQKLKISEQQIKQNQERYEPWQTNKDDNELTF